MFIRSYDNKEIKVENLVKEYLKYLYDRKIKEYNLKTKNVKLTLIESDEWID